MFFLLPLLVCNIRESPQERRSCRKGEYTALKDVKCGGQAGPGILDPASASSAAQFSAPFLASLLLSCSSCFFLSPQLQLALVLIFRCFFNTELPLIPWSGFRLLFLCAFFQLLTLCSYRIWTGRSRLPDVPKADFVPTDFFFWSSCTSYAFFFQPHQLFWLGWALHGVL